MPIATAVGGGDGDAQGSVTFFFHEGQDKHGNPSNKVLGVSNCHVLRENTNVTYEFKGVGAPRQMLADLYAREIVKLEAKGMSADAEDARELRKIQEKLVEEQGAISNLENFYDEVKNQWVDIEFRNIGHVHYAKPISIDVEGERYTENWAAFEANEEKFKAQFQGNGHFKYPEGRQLRIKGIVTKELLANPDLYNSEGQPCLIVGKDGCTDDLTLRGPGVIPLRRTRRGVHRTRHLQLGQEGRRVLSQGRLRRPHLGRPRSHRWPTPLYDFKRRLDQCPRHVCYPWLVAHWSRQGQVSARQLLPHHLVNARTSSAFCSPISTLLLLLRLVLLSRRSVIYWLVIGTGRYFYRWAAVK
ncbi:hypothetical protein AX16_008712, partial [Volvariella volvacea WC 439]